MRIIKLSKEVFGFDTLEACVAFFKSVLPWNKYYFGISGEGNHISKDNLHENESVVFSYNGYIIGIAKVENLVINETRVEEIKLKGNTLKVFDNNSIMLKDLEDVLHSNGYSKKIVAAQGWNIIDEFYEELTIKFLINKEWEKYLE